MSFVASIFLIVFGLIPAGILRFFCKKGFNKIATILLMILLAPIGMGLGAGFASVFGINIIEPSIIVMLFVGFGNYYILAKE